MGASRDKTGEVDLLPEQRTTLDPPKKYRVLLHDDDFTTMDFVVEILMSVFGHGRDVAVQLMLDVHQKGIALAGIYPFEVAEAKAAKVIERARAQSFPFLATLEEED